MAESMRRGVAARSPAHPTKWPTRSSVACSMSASTASSSTCRHIATRQVSSRRSARRSNRWSVLDRADQADVAGHHPRFGVGSRDRSAERAQLIRQWSGDGPPAAATEPLVRRCVLLVVDEREEGLLIGRALLVALGLEYLGIQRYGLLDGEVAARRGQRVDAGEQLVLCAGGQVDQQPLGDPGRWFRWVETVVAQRLWPVVA